MRRSRETNPPHAAERYMKAGAIGQIPGNSMSAHLQLATAGSLVNRILPGSKVKRICPSGAEFQPPHRKALNEAFRLPLSRKPCGPHLHGHAARVFRATSSPRISQQIPKPPRPTAVRQSHANKPNLIAAPGRKSGKYLVQCFHDMTMADCMPTIRARQTVRATAPVLHARPSTICGATFEAYTYASEGAQRCRVQKCTDG